MTTAHDAVVRAAIRWSFAVAAVPLALLAGCKEAEVPPPKAKPASDAAKPETPEKAPAKLEVSSTVFDLGKPIPKKYTDDGEDLSPPLTWKHVPAEAVSLAVVCDDPDAPSEQPWVHWVIYNIPATMTALPEGASSIKAKKLAEFAVEGKNSWGKIGYQGPAPPRGETHHYHFKVYALDAKLGIKAGATKERLLSVMTGHILAEGKAVGRYQR